MKSTSLELNLNCSLYKEMKLKSYVVASLVYDHQSRFEKRTAYLDAQGNLKMHFIDVDLNDSATLCVQVFIQHKSVQVFTQSISKLFDDNHVGTLNVRVSDILSSPTYDFATLCSGKDGNNVLEVSYNLSMAFVDNTKITSYCYAKREIEDKHSSQQLFPN